LSTSDTTLWGIHAGRKGEVDDTFLKKNTLAIGWAKLGDLSKMAPSREEFKKAVADAYPEKKPGAIANNAGQLFRFAVEMKTGDHVAYPSRQDRRIHIGRVDGPYRFDPTAGLDTPHQRPVKWLRSVPRTHFSQGALYEIGSAMTLFQIKTYTEEFLTSAEGKFSSQPLATESDETVTLVADDIEETARDFVLKKLAQELKGHPLAEFVSHLLHAMGYRTRLSSEGPDGGVDVIAHRDELGFEPPIIKVQVKSSEGSVGDPTVASLYGKVGVGEFGMFVTLGTFTSQAKNFERAKNNLRLIDGEALVDLILQHYEQLDPRYKGLIPLKRVYVPEPIEDSEE
jgi:restriction system protein